MPALVLWRLLIVQRPSGRLAQAHIAKAMGISRKCVKTWIDRYAAEGEAGLADRSSRPHSMPTKTSRKSKPRSSSYVVPQRDGQDWLAAELGLPPRTVSRILRRHEVPYLHSATRSPVR
jgi:transposase